MKNLGLCILLAISFSTSAFAVPPQGKLAYKCKKGEKMSYRYGYKKPSGVKCGKGFRGLKYSNQGACLLKKGWCVKL